MLRDHEAVLELGGFRGHWAGHGDEEGRRERRSRAGKPGEGDSGWCHRTPMLKPMPLSQPECSPVLALPLFGETSGTDCVILEYKNSPGSRRGRAWWPGAPASPPHGSGPSRAAEGHLQGPAMPGTPPVGPHPVWRPLQEELCACKPEKLRNASLHQKPRPDVVLTRSMAAEGTSRRHGGLEMRP